MIYDTFSRWGRLRKRPFDGTGSFVFMFSVACVYCVKRLFVDCVKRPFGTGSFVFLFSSEDWVEMRPSDVKEESMSWSSKDWVETRPFDVKEESVSLFANGD